MPPTTYLSEKLVDRLKLVRSKNIGSLYGIYYDSSVVILGLSFEDFDSNEDDGGRNKFGSSQAHYPTEVDYCGLVSFQSDASTENEQLEFIKKSVEGVAISDSPFVSIINVSAPYPPTINLYCYKSKILEPVEYKILSEKEIKKQFITVRLCSKLPLTCESKSEAINEGIANLHKKISAANVMFNIPEYDLFLSDSVVEYSIENLSLDSSVADIFDESSREEGSSKSKRKGKSSQNGLLTAKMLLKSTKSDEENDSHPSGPPAVCQIKHETECLEIFLELDALSMVHVKKKLKHLQNILVDSILRALSLMEEALLKNASSAPVMHHYSLNLLSHFFTIVYPDKVLEDTLKSYRESIHKLLGLPTNQPFFRRGNAHQFDKKEVQTFSPLLINPHEGLGSSGVSKGEVAVVSGKYSYHHYMQDDINDNGWGCAYRSLQLIVSWFRLQGFTNHPVPSHEEIQKCLVEIGDKPQSFVSSQQWRSLTLTRILFNPFHNGILFERTGKFFSVPQRKAKAHFY